MKQTTLLAGFLSLLLLLSACKKEDAAAPKDYSSSIKDKTWWGTLANSGETEQYYSVHFNADGSLMWSQFAGDYSGNWVLNKNKLTLRFPALVVTVTTEITDDNKWANIITNTANKVTSGNLITNPSILLDNTIWKGTLTDKSNGTVETYQLNYKPGAMVELKLPAFTKLTSYTRSVSGAGGTLKIDLAFGGVIYSFGVITSETEMRGSHTSPQNIWQIKKQ